MNTRHAVLVALAAAVALTSVAAAGPAAAKQRVAITTEGTQTTNASPFVLSPLTAGALKHDSGTEIADWRERLVMRDGQRITIAFGTSTYKGRQGNLTTRFRIEWVEAGNGYHVGAGTWKVVRGTGQYAQITGGGRGGHVYLDSGPWSGRAEGFLVLP
jgi:hypothetical protein